MMRKLAPAMIAEAGIVMIQAKRICFATVHRTAEILSPAPTPMMLDETMWVVETGPPRSAAPRMTLAEADWAEKAWIDLSR